MNRSTSAQSSRRLLVRRLCRDRKGVSAIEFALIVPTMMLPLYFGAVEMGFALTAERRVASVASAAADLVAQAKEVSDADLTDILEISSSIMNPLPTAGMSIVLTSVQIDAEGNPKVEWSEQQNGTAYTPGQDFSLPDGLEETAYIIVAEVKYPYTVPVIGSTYYLDHTFYSAPRLGRVCHTDLNNCD